jgi:hypothetical protein
MTDYKQAAVDGTQHQRAFKITIENPYLETPSIVFEEEVVTQVGGKVIKQYVSSFRKDFTADVAQTLYELVNPLDNTPLGVTNTYADVQVAMHSLYLHLAAERDAAEQSVPE